MNIGDTRFAGALRERARVKIDEVEAALKRELARYSRSALSGPMVYALEGGKRIRPLILMFSAEAVGENDEDSLLAAVAVELLHTESMIHDDIIDQEVSRRERMAFHIKYGYSASLLTADFVFGIILDIASRCQDPRVAREISTAALRMCEGEFRELKIDPSIYRLGWEEYIEIITNKTASLFEAAARIGGLTGRGTETDIEALAGFGRNLGIAYQIQDDILDWGARDKVTSALVLDSFGNDPLSHLKSTSREYASLAKRELDPLADSQAKEFLKGLADYAVERDF